MPFHLWRVLLLLTFYFFILEKTINLFLCISFLLITIINNKKKVLKVLNFFLKFSTFSSSWLYQVLDFLKFSIFLKFSVFSVLDFLKFSNFSSSQFCQVLKFLILDFLKFSELPILKPISQGSHILQGSRVLKVFTFSRFSSSDCTPKTAFFKLGLHKLHVHLEKGY